MSCFFINSFLALLLGKGWYFPYIQKYKLDSYSDLLFLPLGKLECEATCFSQLGYQKKRDRKKIGVLDALFLLRRGIFVHINPY